MDPQLEILKIPDLLTRIARVLGNELDEMLGLGLRDYYESSLNKYSKVSNFLFQGVRKDFYSVYFPLVAKNEIYRTSFDIPEQDFYKYPYIVLTGSAGSGKSSLLKHIFLSQIRYSQYIPILIELRHLNNVGYTFSEYITNTILKKSVSPSSNILQRALDRGIFVFLLDGFDELHSSRIEEISVQLQEFVDINHRNRFIVTSRPNAGIDHFPRFDPFSIQPLSDIDIHSFIQKMMADEYLKERVFQSINGDNRNVFANFLSNPLLLSMFLFSVESHPEIPIQRSTFYANVFDALYIRHDVISKGTFARERRSKLTRHQFEELLSLFSYWTLGREIILFPQNKIIDYLSGLNEYLAFDFDSEKVVWDLTISICILIQDGLTFCFPHRSIQEYFCAKYISNLPDNLKKDVYNDVNFFVPESWKDDSHGFLDMCFELDRYDFIEHFLIPRIDGLLSIIQKLKPESTGVDHGAMEIFVKAIMLGEIATFTSFLDAHYALSVPSINKKPFARVKHLLNSTVKFEISKRSQTKEDSNWYNAFDVNKDNQYFKVCEDVCLLLEELIGSLEKLSSVLYEECLKRRSQTAKLLLMPKKKLF